MENKTQEQLDAEYQYDNGFHPKEVILKENYKLYQKGFFFWLGNRITVILSKFFLFFPKFFIWGYRVKGKKNRKYIKGATIVCNHAFTFDAFSIVTALWTKRIYVGILQSNLGFGIASSYFRAGGGVPIPTDPKLFKRYLRETPEILKSGKNVMLFPEAMLMPYCDHIRKFESGAFNIALNGTNKIIMLVHTFHKPKGFYKLVRHHKPCIHLNILEPYEVKDMGNRKLTAVTACNEVHQIMTDYFNSHSDYFTK